MNRLQKRAWKEMIAVFVMIVLFAIPGLLLLSAFNSHGLAYVLMCLIVGTPTGIVIFLVGIKMLKKYDEREKELMGKAFTVSAGVFIFYLLAFSMMSFFLIGGRQSIPVIFMPIMVFTGLVLAQCAQSFVIIWQCEKDDDE